MNSIKGAMAFSLILMALVSNGQNAVGIGVATPNKNAVLELVSPGNNQGFLIPKMTTAHRTAAAFISVLSTKENGLMVFDQDDNKFYYWETNQWKAIGTGNSLQSGDGIDITGTTISTIPQDLELNGTVLTITGNTSATPINLSAFTGTDTDQQTLSYDATTGSLTISRLVGGPQSVVIIPTGTAGGDLTGTYPNPTLNAGAITSTKILDGTITNADINATAGITPGKIAGGTLNMVLTTTAGGAAWANPAASVTNIATGTGLTGGPITATGTIALANTAVSPGLYGSATTVPAITIDAQGRITGAVSTTIAVAPSGAAGGDLTGNYPNPTVANNAITSGKIANLTIVDGDINATAAVAVSKLAASANNGEVLLSSGGVAQWGAPGSSALISAPGTRNLFAAGGSMGGTAGGTDNTFYGYGAGNAATTGSYNVYMGTQAAQRTVTGALNTIIGWRAGFAITPVGFNGNTYVGAQAGENTVDGPNTFIGEKAGNGNIDGTHSVLIGNSAGIANTIGYQNTIIGSLANTSANNHFNATAIGYATVVNASNKVRIGNGAVAVIEGQVPFTNSSDRRLKTNIEPVTNGLELIMGMKPVSYRMKNSSDQRLNWGFIAQDIEKIVGDKYAVLTVGGDKDRTLGLRYTDFIAPMVKAMQEQQVQIEALNKKVNDNEKKIGELEAAVRDFEGERAKIATIMVELDRLQKATGIKAGIGK